jgi:hypothetical protein
MWRPRTKSAHEAKSLHNKLKLHFVTRILGDGARYSIRESEAEPIGESNESESNSRGSRERDRGSLAACPDRGR